jgi:hypothetical protein
MELNRPGCYGSAACVSALSATCRSCTNAPGCVSRAAAQLEALPDSAVKQRARLALSVTSQALGRSPQGDAVPPVAASTRGVQRIALTPAQESDLQTLAPRVRSAVRKLMERGWFAYAKGELSAGRNPADKGWQRLLCRLLLSGGIERDQLHLAFAQELALTPGSARAQASVALAVFAVGQLTRESRGRITFNPN